MIAKKTAIKRHRGAKSLAQYIAAAREKGEKLDEFWLSNCKAGTGKGDLDFAIAEIEATQDMNGRAKGDPNYHLIVSFAEDEKPPREVLEAIENHFAKALGFEDHQRVVGTHINTDNFHMHIMFNKVHPETYRMHTPYRDFKILQKTCAELEKEFGLKVVQGRGKDQERQNAKAQDLEANTWEQSFSSYLKSYRGELLKIREASATWQEFHDGIALYGIGIKTCGNGLVFVSMDTKDHERASVVDRDLSKKRLEEKLGPFVASTRTLDKEKRRDTYRRKPLDRKLEKHPAWKRYATHARRKGFHNWRRFLENTAAARTSSSTRMSLISLSLFLALSSILSFLKLALVSLSSLFSLLSSLFLPLSLSPSLPLSLSPCALHPAF